MKKTPNTRKIKRPKMQKTFRYRIYPTRKQKQILESTLATCRILYNSCPLDRKRHYEEISKGVGYSQQAATLTKDKSLHPSLKAIHSQLLQEGA